MNRTFFTGYQNNFLIELLVFNAFLKKFLRILTSSRVYKSYFTFFYMKLKKSTKYFSIPTKDANFICKYDKYTNNITKNCIFFRSKNISHG